jgi:tetratricopeptide (TPR) repeat protein
VALSALKILIRTKRESVAMWTNMGDCYRKLDRKSAAVDALEKAVTLYKQRDPVADASLRDALYAATVAGNISLQLGNLERAELSYKIAHDIFLNASSTGSSDKGGVLVPILIGLARCFVLDASGSAMRGATARCEQSAKECVAYGEKALVAINNDAAVLATSSNTKKYAVVERVVRTLLGEAHLLMNNFDSAASEFKKCVELFPELASTRENLARALLLFASSLPRGDDDATSKAKSACIDYASAEGSDFSAAWRALAKIPRGKDEEDDASYFGRVETCLSRAVSLGVSQNKATVWASLAQLYKTAADARRQKSSGAEDIIEELERAAATCLDKARTLNPHEGVAWIHTGEEILSKSVFGEDEGNSSVYYEKAAKAFDVATKCAFEDAEHARIADAEFSATAAVAVLSEDIHNTHRYENIAAAIRAARARTNDPVAHWSLAMVCERRGLIDMAKEAFENALDGVLNGDTSTLDFTFGYGESDECRNAITDACKEGLERLEKRRAMTSAAQNDLNDGACATYASLKRRLQNAIREDPSNVHARVHLAQLLLAREEDDDDETFLALNVVSEPRAPFLNNTGGKGDFREQSSVARSVAWSCIANSPAYVYPVKSDDIESDKTRSEVLFRRANRMAAIATVLNPGDARNQDVLQTCLNRLQLRPRASGRVSSFNLDDEKMLRDLSKMAESDPKSNAETIASARLALAAKLAQSEEKEKRKEAKKHATRVSQTNSKTELDEQEREINNIKISERLVRASECFLAGSEL